MLRREKKNHVENSVVITGIATIVYGVAVLFLLPDSPLYARFLTPEERGQAVLRIKENRSGIEQKHFKKEQYEPIPRFLPPPPPCPRQLCCSGSDVTSSTRGGHIDS